MSIRKITSMTMFVSLFVLVINSIILYIVPEGRIAYWADWHLWGLTKVEWGEQHITVGFLFIAASILHLYFNWPAILEYMKNKAREIKVFTGSFNVALVLTLLVVIGTYYEVPPMSTVVGIGGAIKDRAADKYGEPPYGHAETSSLAMFSKKERLDAEKAIVLLRGAGLEVENKKESIKEIATRNKLTPQQVYEIILPASIEEPRMAAGTAYAAAFPDHPRPGFGRKTLAEVCEEFNLDRQQVVRGLKSRGVEADAQRTIKDIATGANREPMEIFELIRSLVVEEGE